MFCSGGESEVKSSLCAQLSRYSLCVKFVSLYNTMSVGSKSLQCKYYGEILFGCGPRYYLLFHALPHALLFSKILLLFLFGEKTNHIYLLWELESQSYPLCKLPIGNALREQINKIILPEHIPRKRIVNIYIYLLYICKC